MRFGTGTHYHVNLHVCLIRGNHENNHFKIEVLCNSPGSLSMESCWFKDDVRKIEIKIHFSKLYNKFFFVLYEKKIITQLTIFYPSGQICKVGGKVILTWFQNMRCFGYSNVNYALTTNTLKYV